MLQAMRFSLNPTRLSETTRLENEDMGKRIQQNPDQPTMQKTERKLYMTGKKRMYKASDTEYDM